MTDADRIDYATTALRRKYATTPPDLAGLRTLANLVRDAVLSGKSVVTITNSGFEGGNGGGEVTWDAVLTGQACENLLQELDTDAPRAGRSSLIMPDRRLSNF